MPMAFVLKQPHETVWPWVMLLLNEILSFPQSQRNSQRLRSTCPIAIKRPNLWLVISRSFGMADDNRPQSVVQGATQIASGAVAAMSSRPIAIALLAMNIIILVFAGYIANSQLKMIGLLVTDIRDCRQGAKQ
jgi:hypothetical protein